MTKKAAKPSSAPANGSASSNPASGKPGSSSSSASQLAPLTPREARAVRQAEADAQKKALFGNWTGKTPLSLFHEHVQRMGWKSSYHTIRLHSGTFQTNVTISKDGQSIRIVPEGLTYATEAESKHFAATYALHRVASSRNFGTVLPPEHKVLWAQLNQLKSQQEVDNGKEWTELQYAADPFAAALARHKKVEEDRKGKVRAAKERDEKQRQIRAALPQLHLNQELRKQVEELIKKSGISFSALEPQEVAAAVGEESSDSEDSADESTESVDGGTSVGGADRTRGNAERVLRERSTTTNPKSRDALPAYLTQHSSLISSVSQLGFHPSHVSEAVEHFFRTHSLAGKPAPNPSWEAILDWLLVHVPEDDLPKQFLDKKYRTGLMASNLTAEELAKEYKVERLKAFGFSTESIRSALASSSGSELLALAHLACEIAGKPNPPAPTGDFSEDASAADTVEEVAALQAIFGEDTIRVATQDKAQPAIDLPDSLDWNERITAITISVPSALAKSPAPTNLTLFFPPGTLYPQTPCIPMVTNPSVPAYVRLHLTKVLYRKSVELASSGNVAGFELAGWVESSMENVVKNPPKLLEWVAQPPRDPEPQDLDSMTATDAGVAPDARQSEKASGFGPDRFPNRPVFHFVPASTPLPNERRDHEAGSSQTTRKHSALFREREARRKELPVWPFRGDIVNAVGRKRVAVICGETGCGKSTQVPQFILDDLDDCCGGVIVTQPRRISAVALATRVAWERGEKVGDTVGYVIRGETVRSARTRLTFVTTGVLLRRLQGEGRTLQGVGCIVVDEVHERGIDSDFLLILLRDLLHSNPNLKVVLMSATVDAATFSNYFGGCPVVDVPGFTYPVRELLVDEVRHLLGCRGLPGVSDDPQDDDMLSRTARSLGASKTKNADDRDQFQIDYQLIADVVHWISRSGDPPDFTEGEGATISKKPAAMSEGALGAVLIFVPGVMEIKRCIETLRSTLSPNLSQFELLPLHANLSPQEQQTVFRPLLSGVRRVVVATNVAETSITIDGVIHVIDTGRVKETSYDSQSRMTSLVETWCSRASAKQRKGRAGRTRPGVCYKLYSKRVATHTMAPFSVPEILRTPLEQLCLTVKSMSIPSPSEFLAKAPDPPTVEATDAAMEILKEVSAVDRETGDLTALGGHMAMIPVDLRIAKVLVMGAVFSCIDSVAGIAACLSGKSPFVSPMDKRAEAQMARASFMLEKSDLLTDLNAFNQWLAMRQGTSRGKATDREFCEKNFLSRNTLTSIEDLKSQYLIHLAEIGFVGNDETAFKAANVNSKNWKVVTAVITAGLYPQVLKIRHPQTTYMQTLSGTVAQQAQSRDFKFFSRDQGRVFVHPGSINFTQSKYDKDGFVVYNALVNTSKVFARDTTVTSSGWPVLLFGGKIQVDHARGVVTVGDWLVMKSFARIGVLANGMRKVLDGMLKEKIENPSKDISDTEIVRLIVTILSTDGI